MKEYAIYLRKSREDKEAEETGKGETLARHEKLLLELAHSRQYPIGEIYREVVSGETISGRPEMIRLLSDVGSGKWAGVLVTEVSRLARGNTSDQGLIAETFGSSGTLIITPTETIDPTNDMDEDRLDLSLFMSRFEYKFIKRRLIRGRNASLEDGKFIGSNAPYGYERYKLPKEKGWSLKIVPEEAEIIRMIYSKYINDRLPVARIAAILNEMKVPTRSGAFWNRTTVYQMLENPVYNGKVWWGSRNPSKRLDKPPAIYEGRHEAILAPGIYDAAQERLAKKQTVPTKSMKNPLAGIIHCSQCGKTMVRLPYTNHSRPDQLMCRTPNCNTVASYLSFVEKKLLKALESWLQSYRLEIEANLPEDDTEIYVLEKALESVEDEISTTKKQLENLYNLLEQGIYTTDIFLERNNTLTAKITALEQRKDTFLQEIEKEKGCAEAQSMIIPKVEMVLKTYYEQTDIKVKNDMLKEVLDSAIYKKDVDNSGPEDFTLEIFPALPRV